MRASPATRRTPTAMRRPALGAVFALVLAGCAEFSRLAAAETPYQPPSRSAAAESRSASSVYRLGTAAAPFGWAKIGRASGRERGQRWGEALLLTTRLQHDGSN